METNSNKIGVVKAITLVVANMIGTGVYTSLGFQAADIKSIVALLLIWLAGGLVALFGALTYGELASLIPKSGGEYQYLSKIYHPSVGFLSGFVSATVAFAAPIAISAMAFGSYFSHILQISELYLALGLIVILTTINCFSFKAGTSFNLWFTVINVVLIIVICIVGFIMDGNNQFAFSFEKHDFQEVLKPAFAVSLVYVSYAFSGWNSAIYVAGQIKEPKKNLPIVLFSGAFIVMFLYLLLNLVFLYTVPVNELAGKIDVGFLSGSRIFGSLGGKIIAVVISIGLIASVNSMMITGPRVTQAIGIDYSLFRKLGIENKRGVPVWATLFQTGIALFMIFTSTFDRVMTYIGFTLSLFTLLSVIGVFILRIRHYNNTGERLYKTWGYPVVPILFVLINLWMIFYIFVQRPNQAIAGFLTALIGIVVYYISQKIESRNRIH